MESTFNIQACKKENIKKILQGINDYKLNKVPATHKAWTPLEFVLKDEHGEEIGGIGYWSGIEIRIL